LAHQIGPVAICDRIQRHRRHAELTIASKQLPISAERIEGAILLIRGEKVLLDKDLALL